MCQNKIIWLLVPTEKGTTNHNDLVNSPVTQGTGFTPYNSLSFMVSSQTRLAGKSLILGILFLARFKYSLSD
jgi:hypothetical protein